MLSSSGRKAGAFLCTPANPGGCTKVDKMVRRQVLERLGPGKEMGSMAVAKS